MSLRTWFEVTFVIALVCGFCTNAVFIYKWGFDEGYNIGESQMWNKLHLDKKFDELKERLDYYDSKSGGGS